MIEIIVYSPFPLTRGEHIALFAIVFAVNFIHLHRIDKDQDDKNKDGTLLRYPETEGDATESDSIQRLY